VKLETTLDERPGFLHALPLFDLFITVTMLLLLGPVFLSQSGVSVELPASHFQMQRYQESIVVTLHSGEAEPQIYLGREALSLAELKVRLEALKADEVMSRAMVLLKTDLGTPVGVQSEMIDLILRMGFKVALVGKTEAETPESELMNE
jgi:biopolymer transport protein ExbD